MKGDNWLKLQAYEPSNQKFGICIAHDDTEKFTTSMACIVLVVHSQTDVCPFTPKAQDVIDYVGSKVWWYNP
jgi:hypothetical protein